MYIHRAVVAAAATLSSGILIPLYIDPVGSPDCSGWAPVIDTYGTVSISRDFRKAHSHKPSVRIAAHPSLPFWVVINPARGPGRHGSQAPAEYQRCIPELRTTNVVVLGYVPTFDAAANKQSGVTQDVDTYAGWGDAYRPDGIFFDQVSGASGDLAVYEGFASHATPLFNGGDSFVGGELWA